MVLLNKRFFEKDNKDVKIEEEEKSGKFFSCFSFKQLKKEKVQAIHPSESDGNVE